MEHCGILVTIHGATIYTESVAMVSDKLVEGIAAVAVLLVISVFLGFGIAAILRVWHKRRPLKESDVQNDKHPLGLDR